jgi:hypothetical protein
MTPDQDRLTTLETMMAQQVALAVALRGIVERQAMQQLDVQARLTRMETTLNAIKDLLERGNGH